MNIKEELEYRKPKVIIRESRSFLCPTCHKRVPMNHSYCHKCGQAISWKRGNTNG